MVWMLNAVLAFVWWMKLKLSYKFKSLDKIGKCLGMHQHLALEFRHMIDEQIN
jgi:hypothetical protein